MIFFVNSDLNAPCPRLPKVKGDPLWETLLSGQSVESISFNGIVILLIYYFVSLPKGQGVHFSKVLEAYCRSWVGRGGACLEGSDIHKGLSSILLPVSCYQVFPFQGDMFKPTLRIKFSIVNGKKKKNSCKRRSIL